MAKPNAKETWKASSVAVVYNKSSCSQLVHIFKKSSFDQGSLLFFEHTNNLRTVARLGVDKFISHLSLPRTCEVLMNLPTLYAWKREEEENFSLFWKRVTF